MAYALLAGVDPRYGLYSAIVVTAVASVFGSSSHLINGPTSAIFLVVLSALSIFDADQRVEAAEAMFLLGVMVGSIQIFIAVFRLGDLTRYISEAVILGFMSAAALLLAIGQVSNALGLRERGTGAQYILYRLWLTLTTGDAVNLKAVTATVATLLLALLFRRVVSRFHLLRFAAFARVWPKRIRRPRISCFIWSERRRATPRPGPSPDQPTGPPPLPDQPKAAVGRRGFRQRAWPQGSCLRGSSWRDGQPGYRYRPANQNSPLR
jgi:MFS superfamily sulfate permease-like transporter